MLGKAKQLQRRVHMVLSARRIEIAEAERMGFVNRVVPDGELLDHATAYIRELAENCSPRSMVIMKRQFHHHSLTNLETLWCESVALMKESVDTADFKEGANSFVEKRPPNFPRITGDVVT